MIINTKGIEVSEAVFLNKTGAFLFKIEKFEEDGYTNAGDAKFKLHFKGVEKGTKEPMFLHQEMFSIGEKSLWKIKLLENGLHAPEIYDINDFIGRWVIGNVIEDKYTKKDGTAGIAYKVNQWSYSTLNDKMPPIPEATQEQSSSDGIPVEIEIEESDIPF